jgi:hypothetical protein
MLGSAESDHSKAEMDFRCLRMEFFTSEYRRLSPGERRSFIRNTRMRDQIMYQVLVVEIDERG